MDLLALALVFLTGALATPAPSLLPFGSALRKNSSSIAALPTLTQVADPSQITPGVPKSEIVTGRYTLTPVPSQCTDSFIPYQTTFWAQQNQMDMEDAVNPSWWGPDQPVDWTFSTNTSGVFFKGPYWIQAGGNPAFNLKPRTAGNSFTLTMDRTDGAQTLLWFVYQGNGTAPGTKAWNSTAEIPNDEQVIYELTISGKLPCAHPIGNNTCSSNKIELSSDAWSAYGVDDFLENWYNNASSTFAAAGGMMQVFGKKFNIGNDHICTIDNACTLVNSCTDLPNHGTDENSAQIYLAWQALQNISDMFNRMYNNLNIAQGDTMTKIAQIALEFYTPIQGAAVPPNPLRTTPGILGMLSAFAGLLPGGGSAIGAALGAASGLIGIINAEKDSAPPQPDPQFAQSDADLGVVFGNYTNSMRTQLQNIHNSIFTGGDGFLKLVQDGTFVDRSLLNINCDDCIPKAQAWLEQMLTLKMINYMWLKQNVFVTFMPYGKIIQLDTLEQTDFTIDACYSNFLTRDEEKNIVACMPDGMARLTYYNPANASTTKPDPDGSVNLNGMPPGADKDTRYNSTEAVSVNFSPSSAAISSVQGYLTHGQGYDAVTALSDDLLSGSGSLQDLWQINATAAGMFTLPVCLIRDLNYWPTFYGQGKNRRASNNYCVCYNDLNSDSSKGAFKDAISGDFLKFVTTWRDGMACEKGKGTEPSVGGSPVGLPPRGTRNDKYVPLPWP